MKIGSNEKSCQGRKVGRETVVVLLLLSVLLFFLFLLVMYIFIGLKIGIRFYLVGFVEEVPNLKNERVDLDQ